LLRNHKRDLNHVTALPWLGFLILGTELQTPGEAHMKIEQITFEIHPNTGEEVS
jgi:hypothetical protein